VTDGITDTLRYGKKLYEVRIHISQDQALKLLEMFPEASDLETALHLYLKYSLR